MAKRKITIGVTALIAVAKVSAFIESEGLMQTAFKFSDDAYDFFEKISNDQLEYRPCVYSRWKGTGYRCVPYKKKYIIAYSSYPNEIVIRDFVSSKILYN